MAYEMKDGEFQITKGSGKGKPIATLKAKVDGKEHDIAFWMKEFNWGTVVSGNFGQIRSIYLTFLKFTVNAVAYYWQQAQEKLQESEQAPATGNRKADNLARENTQSPQVEDDGI